MHDGIHVEGEQTYKSQGPAYIVGRLLEPRRDVFSYCLRERDDRPGLPVGKELSLRGPGVSPPTGAV